jgi:prepilin peptidase CpaA
VFAGLTPAWVSGVTLVALLAIACASDLRTRRIPNWLVLLTAISGTLLAVVTKPWTVGLIHAGAGMATGLALWLPFYLFRMLGAGDVKLFAAAATFLGARSAVEGALYTALYGGVIAFAFMVIDSGWSWTLLRLGNAVQQPSLLRNSQPSHRQRMPYAFAIAAGVLSAVWLPGYILT